MNAILSMLQFSTAAAFSSNAMDLSIPYPTGISKVSADTPL
jgi:ABC-type Co2+ transport system permease subunit